MPIRTFHSPIGVRADFRRRKNWLGSTPTCFRWLPFNSPHIYLTAAPQLAQGLLSTFGTGAFAAALAPGLVKRNRARPLISSSNSTPPPSNASLIPSVGCSSGTLPRAQFTCSVAFLGEARHWKQADAQHGQTACGHGAREHSHTHGAELRRA